MKKIKLTDILSVVLCIGLMAVICLPICVGAAGVPAVSLQSDAVVGAGESMEVSLLLENELRLSSVFITVKYDSELVTANAFSLKCGIADNNGVYDYNINEQQSSLLLSWDTTSNECIPSGKIFTFLFTAKNVKSETSAVFSISKVQIFDNENKKVSSVSVGGEVNTQITVTSLGDLSAFYKILPEKIEFTPECLENIVDAEKVFAGFNASQVRYFVECYPELYSALSSARSIYYELQENITVAEINAAVKSFEEAVAAMPEAGDVTLSNEKSITILAGRYEALSPQVKSRVSETSKEKLEAIVKALETLKKSEKDRNKALDEYNEFKTMYQPLWNLSEDFAASNADDLAPSVLEALNYYDMGLSDLAKELAAKDKEYLNKIYAVILEVIADDEHESELNKAVVEFQEKWKYVIGLSVSKVAITDKAAIQLMLEDIENQSDELKEKLSMRKSLGERLLAQVAQLEKETEKEDSVSSENQGSQDMESSSSSTVTSSQSTSTSSDGATSSLPTVSTQQGVVEVEKEVSSSANVTTVYNSTPKIIVILAILLLISVLTLIWPLIRLFKLNNTDKENELEGGEI